MLRRAAPALLLLVAAFVPSVHAEWPSFHNDARHTGAVSGSSYPVFEDVWWNNKTPLNAQIKASPVLKDNILITASLGPPATPSTSGRIRALDASSGDELWNHTMAASIESTPVISGERVYVVDIAGNLKALNLQTGGVEHTASVGGTLGHLTYNEGHLFVGTEAGEVKSYLASTLTLLWTFRVADISQTATYNNQTKTYACSAPISAQPVRSAPAVYQGRVYFASLNHWVMAVDEQGTGDLKTFPIWAAQTGGVITGTPAIEGSKMYIGSHDGKMYSFVTTTTSAKNNCNGQILKPSWTFQVPNQDGQVSKIHSSPAVAGDKVFFGSQNGKVYAVSTSTGKQVWERTAGSFLQPVTGSPAVANNIVVVGSEDKKVYWLDAADGDVLETFTTQSAIDTSPAIEGDRAFVAARDGTLYMFGPEIPTRADLQVSSVQVTAGRLQVTVQNSGDADATATTVRVLVGGTFLENIAVPALNKSASITVNSATAVPGTGSVVVQAIVDPDNSVNESNDSNNELSQGVSLDPPPAADGGGGGEEDGGGFKIPGLGLVPTLAMLGLALLALRRRRSD